MSALPETILQFGAGNFLRAFADTFVHHANQRGDGPGRIVVVQSTGDGRASLLNQQGGVYQIVVRGLENGEVVDRVERIESVSRSLFAGSQWPEVIDVACSPQLKYVVSNTTEAGYALDDTDAAGDAPPRSFPAKLLAVLHARWQAGRPGVVVMPCELLENNARLLRGLVLDLAQRFGYPAAFAAWVERDCTWLSSLVDRIVPGKPADHPLLVSDPLLLMCEPFAFWALEAAPGTWFDHPAITRTGDVLPYFLRKVRILNGAHTALVTKVGTERFVTVLEAMSDAPTAAWLERLLFEEIVPTVKDRVDGAEAFARQTLERFANPFLKHKLSDIALHHTTKQGVRLRPTQAEYAGMFGKRPALLDALLGESA